MAGIFDLLGGMSPEQNQGLLAAAAQVLRNSGPGRPYTIGMGLGDAIGAYQGNMQQQQQRKMLEQRFAQEQQLNDYALRDKKSDYEAQEKARARAETLLAVSEAYRKSRRGPQSAPPVDRSASAMMQGLMSGGIPQMEAPGAPMPGGMPAGGQGQGGGIDLATVAQERLAYAQALQDAGLSAEAFAEQEKALKMLPEFDTTPRTANDASGKPFQYLVGKRGERKVLEGTLPREELKLMNLGGKELAYNPFELKDGQSFQRTMDPGQAAANALGWANHGLSKQRLALDRQTQGPGGMKAPTGYRWAADGSLEAIPGGPATKGATATEGERKAATLMQRLQFSESQLEDALKDDPNAATPNLLAQGLRGIGAEAAANSTTSEARQRVDTAQLDILDAALTLGTGAAYTREQLEGYRRSYFPQIGDSEGTIKDKRARLNNVIGAAKLAAGRAAPPPVSAVVQQPAASGTEKKLKSAMKGQVMDGYRFKGGNPADPNAWEKL